MTVVGPDIQERNKGWLSRRFWDVCHRYGEIGSSLSSALSGNPSSLDAKNRALWNRIQYGRNFQELTPFSIDVTKHEKDYNTLWLKSANGAYCVVRTHAPFKEKGSVTLQPAYVLMFSPDPTILGRLFLYKDDQNTLNDQIIENNVSVVAARFEKDIIPSASHETDNIELNFSWVREAARAHVSEYQETLKNHGILTKDGKRIWRSGSSMIWANPRGDGYDMHYYCNPRFGKEGMFLTEETLNNRVVRTFLNGFSVKLNKDPVPEEGLDNFIREKFPQYIRAQLNGKDPYYHEMPCGFVGKLSHIMKTGTLRFVQKMANFARNVNWMAVGKSALLTGGLTLGLYVMGQGFLFLGLVASAPAAAMKGNVLFKAIGSSIRRASRFIIRDDEIQAQGRSAEIGPVFCDRQKVDFGNDTKNFPIDKKYLPYMEPVPIDYICDAFKKTQPYDEAHERLWAQNVLLDTMGCHPGTVFTEVNDHGHTFLVSQQPNGVDVDYHPERSFAYACRRQAPEPGHCLEVPIKKLFDSMPEGHRYYAVKHVGDGDILHETFSNAADFPYDVFTYETDKPVHDFSIDAPNNRMAAALLPERIVKKQEKEREAVLKKFFNPANVDDRLIPIEAGMRRELMMPRVGTTLSEKDIELPCPPVHIDPSRHPAYVMA